MLTYKALNGLAPSNQSEMSVPVSVGPALRRSGSADGVDLTVPRATNAGQTIVALRLQS